MATHTLSPSASRQTIDQSDGIAPGDDIVLSAGTYNGLIIKLLWGTAAQPIRIIPSGSVIIDTRASQTPGIKFEFCRHIRLMGNGDSGTTRLLRIRAGAHGLQVNARSDHFEIAYIHISEARNATALGLTPWGYTASSWPYGAYGAFPTYPSYESVGWNIHHNLIENPDGIAGDDVAYMTEGMYLGKNRNSEATGAIPDYNELYVHHNIIRNTRWEAMQIVATSRQNPVVCDVYNNWITGDSIVAVTNPETGQSQKASIYWKDWASGRCFNNIIWDSHSHGILLSGDPEDTYTTQLYNNIIVRTGISHADSWVAGIRVGQNRRRLLAAHNTIVSPGPASETGINLSNSAANIQLRNNLLVDTNPAYILGTGAGHVVTPSQAATTFVDGSTLDFIQISDPYAADYYAIGADSAAADASTDNAGVGDDFNGTPRPAGSTYALGAYEPALPSGGSEPVDVTLSVQYDGATYEGNADNQAAAAAKWTTNNPTGARRRALVRFNLDGLAGVTVQSATLRIFNDLVGVANRTISIYRVKAANSGWVAGCTWNYASPTTVRWAGDAASNGGTDAGCTVSGTDFEATRIGQFTIATTDTPPKAFDVTLNTAQFQTMVDGANYGFVLFRDDTVNNAVTLWTGDATDPAYAPKLLVTYVPAGASQSAPDAPSALTATAISTSQIDLSWTDNSDDETGFEVEQSANGTTGWAKIADRGANITAHSVGGLSASTQYFFRVRAVNAVGNSSYTSNANATTQAAPAPDPTVPDAPSDFAAAAASATQINLTWTDNATDESGYQIRRGLLPEQYDTIIDVEADTESYNDTGLTPVTTYYYELVAQNAAGSSLPLLANATTQAQPTAPAAPSSLTATALSAYHIGLAWTPNNVDHTGLIVEKLDALTGSWQVIASLAPSAITHTATGLDPATEYQFRVKAINAVGDSPYSNIATETTDAAPDAPTPPLVRRKHIKRVRFLSRTVAPTGRR